MSIMAESGIDVGVESHLTLLLGMIRAGKSLAEVEAKMSEATTTSNVVFGDHEVFRLIVELVRAGNKVCAFSRLESHQGLALVLAQLVELSLPTPVVCGSNRLANNFQLIVNLIRTDTNMERGSQKYKACHSYFQLQTYLIRVPLLI